MTMSTQRLNGSPSSRSTPIKIAVIGMSGQGKSTLLNALADDGSGQQHFKTGSGWNRCTTEVLSKTFELKCADGDVLPLSLQDTMGFPDTNPESAIVYYDQVVEACKQPLDAILWVHKAERFDFNTIEKMQSLMQEFNKAKPPIILVVNGTRNYGRMPEAAKKKQKAIDLKEHMNIGRELKEKSGVEVKFILAGADLDDLYDDVKTKLGFLLKNTTPKTSDLKTHAQLKSELDACKSHDAEVAYGVRKLKDAQERAEHNLSELKEKRADLQKLAVVVGVAGAAAAGIPFFGPALAAAAVASAYALKEEAAAMQDDINAAIDAAAATVEKLKSAQKDKDAASKVVENARKHFEKVNETFEAQQKVAKKARLN